jgi:hypothetical protein
LLFGMWTRSQRNQISSQQNYIQNLEPSFAILPNYRTFHEWDIIIINYKCKLKKKGKYYYYKASKRFIFETSFVLYHIFLRQMTPTHHKITLFNKRKTSNFLSFWFLIEEKIQNSIKLYNPLIILISDDKIGH